MQFRILGPLEVSDDGKPVAIRGRHHPKLLALLLVDAGRVVSAGRLIEALWNENPPETAGRQVQNIAGALRKQLGAGAGRLETIGKGYRLTVDPGDLDLARYKALVTDARRQCEAGRLESARDRLVEALGEWRGPALAGLSGRLIESVAAQLDELRLATIEERIDVDLELNRCDGVVGELGVLLAEHPLRQRFAAQLMLALHRGDRTVEALAVYDRTRRHIGEKLGLDPGRLLRDLHGAILREDPQLSTAARVAPVEDVPGRNGSDRIDAVRAASAQSVSGETSSGLPAPQQVSRDRFISGQTVQEWGTSGRAAPGEAVHGRAASEPTTSSQASPRPTGQAVPAQLPADVGAFSGRREQLAVLDSFTLNGPTAIMVCGPGGIGKTALSVHWAHARRDWFPDGQLYINLRGYDRDAPVTADQALNRLIRSLGIPSDAIPSDMDDEAALYRSLLAERRMLVVLDNARTPDQVRPLLPGGVNSLALVTSRERLSGLIVLDDARSLDLDPLSELESERLLAEVSGTGRLFAVPGAAARLAQLCGHAPLALRIAAANLASRPHQDIAEFMSQLEGSGRLDALAVDGDSTANVAAGIDLSINTLDTETRRLFFQLGCLPGEDFPLDMVADVADRPAAATAKLLDRLVSAHLVTEHRSRRFVMHDLVRLYAARRAEVALPQDDRSAMADRVIGWFERHDPSTGGYEYHNLLATIERWEAHPEVWRAVEGLSGYLRRGEDPFRIGACGELGLRAATAHGSQLGIAWMHNIIARSLWAGGDSNSTVPHGERALAAAQAAGNLVEQARMLNNLSAYESSRGNVKRSIELQQACVALEADLLPPAERAESMANLAETLRLHCRFAEAKEWLTTGYPLSDNPDHRIANLLTHVYVCVDLGQGEEALTLAVQARDIAQHHRMPLRQQQIEQAIGVAHRTLGNWDESEMAFRASLDLVQRNDRDRQKIFVQCELANLLHQAGRLPEAAETAREALAAARQVENQVIVADAALLLCRILAAQGQYDAAKEFGELAAGIPSATPVPLFGARLDLALAAACAGLGDEAAAEDHRKRAGKVYGEFDTPEAWQALRLLGQRPVQ